MWEIIRANRRKSWILFLGMGGCLLALGYIIGEALVPSGVSTGGPGGGGPTGLLLAALLWFAMSLTGYFSGDSILLAASKAREVSRDVHPRLFNVVEEMKIASGAPAMPKIYIIDDPAPNAFATGRKPERSAIAVTAGLLSRLNRDELQGVVAHEMSHIVNRDVQFMTFAGVLLGGIVLVSHVFLRGMFYSRGMSRRFGPGGKGGGQAQALFLALALVLAILAPIAARLLYFAISRRREYLADATAARLTRYPEGLASALEKISASTEDLASANKVTAPMYIVNPLKPKGKRLSNLTSTHPPVSDRIRILRSMAGGAGYYEYQRAFTGVTGEGAAVIPRSVLKKREKVPVRKASKEKGSRRKTLREVGDIVRAANAYAFLVCACGLRIKVPPDFKRDSVTCPRCGRKNEIPVAELAALGAATAAAATGTAGEGRSAGAEGDGAPQTYTRKGSGWESFRCRCGRLLQISPALEAPSVRCRDCGSEILIQS